MTYTNTGTTIPASLTDAPTAYKDGVTDALWHPAITLTFGREITDAEIAALLAGAVSVQQDDGRYLTSYTLDGRRLRYHSISITLPYTTKATQESPRWLRQQTTDADLARMEAEQRATDLDLQLLEVGA